MRGSLAVVAFALVLSLAVAVGSLHAQATLVLLVDETGPGARTGMIVRTAADQTARQVAEAAEAGRGERLVLRVVEYGGSPERAVELMRGVLADGPAPAAVLGACDTETTAKVAVLLRRAGVPMLCPVPLGATATLPLTGDDAGWVDGVFQMATSAPRQVAALVDYAADRLGAKRLGLVYGGADWAWAAEVVRRRAGARGLSLAFATEIRDGGQPPDVARCDALIVASDRDPGVDVAAWALGRPSRPAVLAVSSLLLTGPVPSLEGAVVTVTGAYDPAEPQTERFGRLYGLEYARVPGETVLLTRDALILLAEALRIGGGAGRLSASLRRAASMRGLTGPLAFDSEGRRTAPIALVEVRGRSVRPLGPAGGSVPVPSVLSPSAAVARVGASPSPVPSPAVVSSAKPFGSPWWQSDGAAPAPTPAASPAFSPPSPPPAPAAGTPWWQGGGAAPAPSPSPASGTPWWTQGSSTAAAPSPQPSSPTSPADSDLPWWKRPDVASSLPSLPPAPRPLPQSGPAVSLPPVPAAGIGLPGLPPPPASPGSGLPSLPLPPAAADLSGLPPPPQPLGIPARVTPLPPPTPTPTPTPTTRPTPSPTGGSQPWWQSGEASY